MLGIGRKLKSVLSPLEVYFLERGFNIVGLDEVGRGCIAGPVVVGGVVLTPDSLKALENFSKDFLLQIQDSKTVKPQTRAGFVHQLIKIDSLTWFVDGSDVSLINKVGVAKAVVQAMQRILKRLKLPLEKTLVLIDGAYISIPPTKYSTLRIKQGDSVMFSIKLASNFAKYFRDYWMSKKYHKQYPYFDFRSNKGYATSAHIKALKQNGVSKVHRLRFCENLKSIGKD